MGLLLSVSTSAYAQNYAIDWWTVDGGGGASTGGVFAVSGTIGQPDAGAMSGGNFSLTGGFWALYAVQTPGAPLLAIRLTATNSVVISWPSPSTGFLLQQNSNASTTNWVNVSQAPTDDGTTRSVVIYPPAGSLCFRMKK